MGIFLCYRAGGSRRSRTVKISWHQEGVGKSRWLRPFRTAELAPVGKEPAARLNSELIILFKTVWFLSSYMAPTLKSGIFIKDPGKFPDDAFEQEPSAA